MPATPKKIGFDDIRKGDAIRVVDVRDVKITSAEQGGGVYAGALEILRENWSSDAKRTFQLLDREHSPIPTERGSVIEVDGERFILVYDQYAPTDLWVSSRTGEKLQPERLQHRANAVNGFEVIA